MEDAIHDKVERDYDPEYPEGVITQEMYNQGFYISIALGIYYTANAIVPISLWYGNRDTEIRSLTNNKMYKGAWYFMYVMHWAIFMPMMILWPLTYTRNAVLLDFYYTANWYLGTLGGTAVYALTALWFLIAAIAYQDTTVVLRWNIWLEVLAYLVIEGFAWYTTVYEYPKARDWYYKATTVTVADTPDDGDEIKQSVKLAHHPFLVVDF